MASKKGLQVDLDRLNAIVGSEMELDYAACYGGYCLVDSKVSIHVTPRMSARELCIYLRGALDWVTP
tara:strand:- start:220 stop:420 length:201 start_codon:yes stop_codon:yes gene_type:complete